jgi:hypothetical protein
MTYQKPALFLVGAAQGIVLGGQDAKADFSDNSVNQGNCRGDVSRDSISC